MCARVRARPAARPLRRHLSAERTRLPLFDTPRHVRDLESLYQRMMARWRAGLAPATLDTARG